MAKVTGKLQITLPKALAEQFGIRVGDELDVRAVGAFIRIEKRPAIDSSQQRADRLAQFDRATARQKARQRTVRVMPAAGRGWSREDLYDRGRAR